MENYKKINLHNNKSLQNSIFPMQNDTFQYIQLEPLHSVVLTKLSHVEDTAIKGQQPQIWIYIARTLVQFSSATSTVVNKC